MMSRTLRMMIVWTNWHNQFTFIDEPNGGFLYFRPVELLVESFLFFPGVRIECGAFTNRNDPD
jgi:hypothetical protein